MPEPLAGSRYNPAMITHILRTAAARAIPLAAATAAVAAGAASAAAVATAAATTAAATAAAATAVNTAPTSPAIHTEDVDRFFALYDSTGGHPTADQLQHEYLDKGTDGLHQLAKARNVTGQRMADMLAKQPGIYQRAKTCLAILPKVRERLTLALSKLGQLYPEARFPPVTIAVGRGKPVGIGSPATGVQIGLEALCGTDWLNPNLEDRFVYVITHEYAHVQQVAATVDDEYPTVLEASLVEGAAEFVAELTAGSPSYSQLASETRGREKDIETAFVPDEDQKDLSKWLYNSTYEKHGDLGYWVGYRIVKAYYQHSKDKRRALREILQMNDPHAFLKASGWYPGIQLK